MSSVSRMKENKNNNKEEEEEEEEEEDHYSLGLGFIMEQYQISGSQELLLRHQPFVGEQVKVNDGEGAPSSSICMLSVSQLLDLRADSDALHNFKGQSDSSHHLQMMKRFKLSHPNPVSVSDSDSDSDSSKAPTLGVPSHHNKANEKLGSASKTPFSNVEQLSRISMGQNKKISSSSSAAAAAASVFDVLKALSDNCGGGGGDDDDEEAEEEDGVQNLSLLEAFKKSGLTFPRPRWWPQNDNNFNNSRIV